VLLRKNPDDSKTLVPAEVLKQRLEEMLLPDGKAKGSLALIDSFLQEQHGVEVVGDAVRVAKPLFMQAISQKANVEAIKLLNEGFFF